MKFIEVRPGILVAVSAITEVRHSTETILRSNLPVQGSVIMAAGQRHLVAIPFMQLVEIINNPILGEDDIISAPEITAKIVEGLLEEKAVQDKIRADAAEVERLAREADAKAAAIREELKVAAAEEAKVVEPEVISEEIPTPQTGVPGGFPSATEVHNEQFPRFEVPPRPDVKIEVDIPPDGPPVPLSEMPGHGPGSDEPSEGPSIPGVPDQPVLEEEAEDEGNPN